MVVIHERGGTHGNPRGMGWDSRTTAEAIHEAADLVPTDPPSAFRARVLGELSFLAGNEGRVEEARRLAEDSLAMPSAGQRARPGWASSARRLDRAC
jgi:hypothetical protein